MENLEKAIDHAKEVAKEQREKANAWRTCAIQSMGNNKAYECEKCAADHLELAGWLEELRIYRGAIEDLIDGNITTNEAIDKMVRTYNEREFG